MLEKDPRKRVSAEQALNSEYFQCNYVKYANAGMDIEQEKGVKKYPLMEINFNQAHSIKNNSLVGEKMVDENNEKKLMQSIGQSVKKKLSFTGNLSGYRTMDRK